MLKFSVLIFVAVLVVSVAALRTWRLFDARADGNAIAKLVAISRTDGVFDPAMVAGLPEPAQRYFAYTIAQGTPIKTAVELDMRGELGMGTKAKPQYRPFRARQILAPPHGLVWRLNAGVLAGSDGVITEMSWTRFWLFGLMPVVRVGGDADHRRSALGRVVAEAAFWSPASLLPSDRVRWADAGPDVARAIVSYGGFEQAVDIALRPDGQPSQVTIQRWSAENPDKVYRLQPFGGYLSEYRDFNGYRLPTRVEGGNHIGTDEYFPFFKAEVTAARHPEGR